jgi:hypothetical protein
MDDTTPLQVKAILRYLKTISLSNKAFRGDPVNKKHISQNSILNVPHKKSLLFERVS